MSPNSVKPPCGVVEETTRTNVEERACSNAEEKLHTNLEAEACTNVEERRFSAASSLTKDAGFSHRGRTFYPGAFAAIILLALSFSAQAQHPAADLPPGAMQAKATTTCL